MWGFLKFWGRAVGHAFSAGWAVVGVASTVLPFIVAGIQWALPNSSPNSTVKWLGDNQLITCIFGFCITLLCYLVWAPYRLWKEENTKLLALQGDDEESSATKPKLKVELKYDQGRSWNTLDPGWKLEWEAIDVFVTNLGPPISISQIEMSITNENGMDVILSPHPPIPLVPQILETNRSLGSQRYILNPGETAKILKMNPRVIVKTSCGHTKTAGKRAFESMKPLFGGELKPHHLSPAAPPDSPAVD